jgi:hypothetical protein
MIKAIVHDGKIRPLEPLPKDWHEGQEVRVEKLDDHEALIDEIDRDFAALAALCEISDPAEEDRLEQALRAAHCQAKEQVRKQMGL